MLAPYYSSGDMQSLRARLTELVNAVSTAEPDNERAQTVIGNLEQWAEDLHRTTKELLRDAVKSRSHFTIHLFQWIQGVTEILLVASNAPACDDRSQRELRNHAGWLIATLDWVPEDQESVRFAENLQLTEILFESATNAQRHGCEELAEEIRRSLVSWAFKGGRYTKGGRVLAKALCGGAALALRGHAGAVDALRAEIGRHLQSKWVPEPKALAHGADGMRREAQRAGEPGYTSSRIDRAMARIDYERLVALLEEIADTLSRPAH